MMTPMMRMTPNSTSFGTTVAMPVRALVSASCLGGARFQCGYAGMSARRHGGYAGLAVKRFGGTAPGVSRPGTASTEEVLRTVLGEVIPAVAVPDMHVHVDDITTADPHTGREPGRAAT